MIVDWNRRGARRASSVMMKSAGPVAAALVLAVASPARAQISVGAIVPVAAQASVGGILPGPVQGSDSAYDPAHGVFLVVSHCYMNCSFSPYGAIFGIFVNPAGTPVTAPFAISASPNGWFPHVRYAQALNAGAGGFLVAWAEEGGGGHSVVKVATISYPGLIVSPPNTISDATSYTSIITGPALGYSPVNQRFLVAWATNALNAIAPTAPPVVGRLVDLMGNPLTSVFAVSGLSAHDPNVTWNSTNNVFGVSFIAESCPACSSAPIFAGFAQVSPVDASLIRQSFNQISGQMKVTDIDYNPDTNHYVMVWWQGVSGSPVTETRAAEIDTGANVVAAGLLSNSFAYLLSTAFNPISRTFLMAGVLASDRVGAIELNGHGLPLSLTTALTVTTPATVGRSARVASSTAGPLWNVNYVDSYTSVKNLAVTTATTGGGAPGSLGAPPAVRRLRARLCRPRRAAAQRPTRSCRLVGGPALTATGCRQGLARPRRASARPRSLALAGSAATATGCRRAVGGPAAASRPTRSRRLAAVSASTATGCRVAPAVRAPADPVVVRRSHLGPDGTA